MALAPRWLPPGENGWEHMTEGLQRVANYQMAGVFSQPFMRIYWHLFYTMSLTLLGLRIFGWLFLECGSAVRQCRTIERPWPRKSESRTGPTEHGAGTAMAAAGRKWPGAHE